MAFHSPPTLLLRSALPDFLHLDSFNAAPHTPPHGGQEHYFAGENNKKKSDRKICFVVLLRAGARPCLILPNVLEPPPTAKESPLKPRYFFLLFNAPPHTHPLHLPIF